MLREDIIHWLNKSLKSYDGKCFYGEGLRFHLKKCARHALLDLNILRKHFCKGMGYRHTLDIEYTLDGVSDCIHITLYKNSHTGMFGWDRTTELNNHIFQIPLISPDIDEGNLRFREYHSIDKDTLINKS
jgi:hypothetical protein